MADPEISAEISGPNISPGSNQTETETEPEIELPASKSNTLSRRNESPEKNCGWLFKRSRFSRKWRLQWFYLDRNMLRYGNNEKDMPKKIFLEGARILESNKDSKLHAFCIKPRSGKRLYYLHADNELGRNKWMQAICFAKMANTVEERNSICTVL